MADDTDLPTVAFPTREQWRAWLHEHHARAPGLHLQLAKKGTGIKTVTLDEAQEVALCYGWIDSLAGRIDDQWWTVKFTPRRPKGNWSRVNKERVERLIARGEMRPAGLREIEAAKADGRWNTC